MTEPYEDWLTTGELRSDAYVGCVERGDGAAIEYALFGIDPEREDDVTEGPIDSVPDDLEAEGCKCRLVRVAVIQTDEGSIEVADDWHSDRECPANARYDRK
jgi:hypothetical protein